MVALSGVRHDKHSSSRLIYQIDIRSLSYNTGSATVRYHHERAIGRTLNPNSMEYLLNYLWTVA